jgi:hypothetical protein
MSKIREDLKFQFPEAEPYVVAELVETVMRAGMRYITTVLLVNIRTNTGSALHYCASTHDAALLQLVLPV